MKVDVFGAVSTLAETQISSLRNKNVSVKHFFAVIYF